MHIPLGQAHVQERCRSRSSHANNPACTSRGTQIPRQAKTRAELDHITNEGEINIYMQLPQSVNVAETSQFVYHGHVTPVLKYRVRITSIE